MENYTENPDSLIFKNAKGIDAPRPNMLFSSLWHQDELAVFFGNQQSGKSLLAVQIAEAISTGKAMEGFKLESAPQKVLYFDFDKSGYHFNQLYANHQFSPNFRRLVVNKKNLDFKHLAEQFFFSVEELMCEEGASVLIFDSLPAIKCFVKDSYFLKGIQRLKEYSDLSILLVGETKKEIKGKPLRLNHLDAHKQLMGFADSVFAMGSTSGEADERYLIHLKSNEKRIYHKDNVITGKIQFPSTVLGSARTDSRAVTGVTPVTPFFPGFVFSGYNTESCVIAPPPDGLELDILTLKQQQPELSFGQIAKELKTNKMKVKRVLERYEKFEHGLSGLGDGADENSVTDATSFSNPLLQPGGMVNTASPAKIPDPAGNDRLPHNRRTPALLNSDPFRGEVVPSDRPSDPGVNKNSSPCPLPLHTASPQGGMPNAEQDTNNTPVALNADPFRGEVVPSDRPSDSGVNKNSSPCPLPLHTASPQGGMPNAEPDTNNTPVALNSDPFRGEVVPSDRPSDSGVKPSSNLTFSQRLKKQIANKNKERMKNR